MISLKRAVAGMVATAALATGLSAPSASGAKELTVAIETDLRGFDAIKSRVLGIAASTVMNATNDRLIQRDADENIEPQLATEWTASADGKTYTFTLRQGVKFHNGDDFTARDVVEHWSRLLDPANKYFGRLFFSPIEKVVADGDHTVSFQLKHPWLPMERLHAGVNFGTYVPSSRAVAEDTMNREPVGTGAYMLTEWRSGDRVIVDKNPNYWDADKVSIDRVVFRIIPDQATRYAALLSGDVDVIWTDRGDTIEKAMEDGKLTVHSRVGQGAIINFMNTAKPPFDNVDARRAVQHAWNQATYLKVSFKDTVPAVEHPLGASSTCDAGYRGPDNAMAKEFAAKAEAATGSPIAYEMIHTSTQRGRESGEIMQQLNRRAGITVNLQPVDQLQLRQKVFTNNYNMSGWRIADAQDVGPQLFALLHSKSPYNLTKYNNPKMDELLVKMRTAGTEESRAEAMCNVVRLMNDEVPIQYRGGRKHYTITQKGISGMRPLYQGVPDVRYLTIN
ncbi:MAG: ABC transporter substrate-binding protein [Minwuia sp.]|uniref:ABC transporter substrate-binding protein n=1 Tax=Minwuia sp. TaxID=2493630 RepID=UPI003A89C5C3